MNHENNLLAELESREELAAYRADWIARWVEDNRPALLRSELDTTSDVLLAQVNTSQSQRLCQAVAQIMLDGSHSLFVVLMNELLDEALPDLATDACKNHCAQLEDDMSEEAWERYQQRSAA